MRSTHRLWIFLILALFSALLFRGNRNRPGDDLSSSYMGCKVLAAHEPNHLYSRDSHSFEQVGDPAWVEIESLSDFGAKNVLHPYVQTPLWGYVLEPLCTRTKFPLFRAIFIALESACMALLLWMAVKFWSPAVYERWLGNAGWVVLAGLMFFRSSPVRYSLFLGQTHVFFVLLTLLALLLARRNPVAAGGLLALAAAVKVTPVFFFFYWLATRQYKAALSLFGWSLAIVAVTIGTTGWGLFLAYLHNLAGASDILLVSMNNQSLPAWLMGYFYPKEQLRLWQALPLPLALKITTQILALASAVLGGLMDWTSRQQNGLEADGPVRPGYGAIVTLVGVTIFAPISWSHYAIILVVPMAMLADAYLRQHSRKILLAFTAMLFLTLVPTHILENRLHLVRAQFYASLIAIAGLSLMNRRESESVASAEIMAEAKAA